MRSKCPELTVRTSAGAILPDAVFSVFYAGTQDEADIFSSAGAAEPLEQPVNVSSKAMIQFYAEGGLYDIRVEHEGDITIIPDVQIGSAQRRDAAGSGNLLHTVYEDAEENPESEQVLWRKFKTESESTIVATDSADLVIIYDMAGNRLLAKTQPFQTVRPLSENVLVGLEGGEIYLLNNQLHIIKEVGEYSSAGSQKIEVDGDNNFYVNHAGGVTKFDSDGEEVWTVAIPDSNQFFVNSAGEIVYRVITGTGGAGFVDSSGVVVWSDDSALNIDQVGTITVYHDGAGGAFVQYRPVGGGTFDRDLSRLNGSGEVFTITGVGTGSKNIFPDGDHFFWTEPNELQRRSLADGVVDWSRDDIGVFNANFNIAYDGVNVYVVTESNQIYKFDSLGEVSSEAADVQHLFYRKGKLIGRDSSTMNFFNSATLVIEDSFMFDADIPATGSSWRPALMTNPLVEIMSFDANANSWFVIGSNAELLGLSGGGNLGQDLDALNQSGDDRGNESINLQSGRQNDSQVALGYRSVAIGYGASTSGMSDNAISVGSTAYVDGQGSMAFGNGASATGDNAISVGSNAYVDGEGSMAFGAGSYADDDFSVAIGRSTYASSGGGRHVLIGDQAQSYGDGNIGIGYNTQLYGSLSTAVGDDVYCNGSNAVCIGHDTQAQNQGNVAVGDSASAQGNNCLAFGYQTTNNRDDSASIGDRDLFLDGNGRGIYLRSPDGTVHHVTVDNSGQLVVTEEV